VHGNDNHVPFFVFFLFFLCCFTGDPTTLIAVPINEICPVAVARQASLRAFDDVTQQLRVFDNVM